jgi:hypothetical protein
MIVFSSLPYTKVIPLENKANNILLIEFLCVVYPKLVQSMLTLYAFNIPSSFYLTNCFYVCLHTINSFSNALILVRDLDICTSNNFKVSPGLFFLFSTIINLLNNFLFNFLTFTSFLHKSS